MLEGICGYPVLRHGFRYALELGRSERTGGYWPNELRRATNGQLKQCLRCLARQMTDQIQKAIFISAVYVVQPLLRNAVAQQIAVRNIRGTAEAWAISPARRPHVLV